MTTLREPVREDIQAFWKAVYEQAYAGVDSGLTPERLHAALDDLEDMFRLRRHLAVTEMPIADLDGREVLEIGPGAGGHSALFARAGARMTSLDITLARARATRDKFRLLGERAQGCAALQGDAETLPFADGTFDIVYSNGVLHHTLDTERAVDEVYRVLKPGGLAVIMLYCKSSWHYWINLFLCEGVLMGNAFRHRNWLGRVTEWPGRRGSEAEINPVTRAYSRRGMEELFHRFEDLSLRKHEFYFYLIPKLGRLYRRWQIGHYGTHPGGLLVYGEPWPIWSPLEAWLGPRMGFTWNLRARKPGGERQ